MEYCEGCDCYVQINSEGEKDCDCNPDYLEEDDHQELDFNE